MRKLSVFIVMGVLLVLLTSCSGERASSQAAFTWKLTATEIRLENRLGTQKGTALYDGSILSQDYLDTPAVNNVYLLINLVADKQKSGNRALRWEDIAVISEDGTSFSRMANDTFIENHNFTRMQGTDLQLGENTGWICVELSEQKANSKLYLVHTTEEGINKIQIK